MLFTFLLFTHVFATTQPVYVTRHTTQLTYQSSDDLDIAYAVGLKKAVVASLRSLRTAQFENNPHGILSEDIRQPSRASVAIDTVLLSRDPVRDSRGLSLVKIDFLNDHSESFWTFDVAASDLEIGRGARIPRQTGRHLRANLRGRTVASVRLNFLDKGGETIAIVRLSAAAASPFLQLGWRAPIRNWATGFCADKMIPVKF